MHSQSELICSGRCIGTWSSFLDYLERRKAEALGNDNCYFFYQSHGRLPTVQEAVAYYEDHAVSEPSSQAHSDTG